MNADTDGDCQIPTAPVYVSRCYGKGEERVKTYADGDALQRQAGALTALSSKERYDPILRPPPFLAPIVISINEELKQSFAGLRAETFIEERRNLSPKAAPSRSPVGEATAVPN